MSRVIVVGGGIAGLGAAWALQQAGIDVSVLEAEDEPGGRMRSRQWNGAWIDLGAEFITSNDEGLRQLAVDVGIDGDRLEYPGQKVGFRIWRDGAPHYLSYTEPKSFLTFGAMTWRGKAQLLRLVPTLARQARRNGGATTEPWRAAAMDDGESVETWLSRVAPEFLEYVVEPCYELYCGYEPHDFGKAFFVYLSTVYRSTEIYTFREGLGQLTRAVAGKLAVTTGAVVRRVDVSARPVTVDYEHDGATHRATADLVLMATPGTQVAGIVDGLDPARRRFFDGVRYTPHELPFFRLRERTADVPTPGVFFPRREDPDIAAIGYDRSSTSADVEFFRVSMKTGHITRHLDRSDEDDLDAILAAATRRCPDTVRNVEDRFVSRWREALPLFPGGYVRALDEFLRLPPLDGLAFCGDYLAGPGTGFAYASGQRAAAEVTARLGGGGR